MGDFLKLLPPSEARSILLSQVAWPITASESVPSAEGLNRVTAEDVLAPHPLPEFARSTVDGFAVNARDTFGSSASQASYLSLVGEVPMGMASELVLEAGQCALIHTGGMLPAGADAVVMLEYATAAAGGEGAGTIGHDIEILRPAAPGENVIRAGEDVTSGQTVLRRGTRLGPAHVGGLMALGILSVRVTRRPIVAVISSGDEVVEPGVRTLPGQVRDVNGSALAALVRQSGAIPRYLGIVPDAPGKAESAARTALREADVVVITAGSSASTRDLTAGAIASLGAPGVLVHGLNMRPGKPTILGVCNGKAVFGLPGNPVSALIVARLLLVPLISRLQGMPGDAPRATVAARLSVNLPSQAGREDWWPVILSRVAGAELPWVAEPIFGRSNLIFSLASADGLICIPAASNGVEAGETVEVEPI